MVYPTEEPRDLGDVLAIVEIEPAVKYYNATLEIACQYASRLRQHGKTTRDEAIGQKTYS